MDLSEIIQKRIVYEIPGMEQAQVRKDLIYHTVDETNLKCDVYYPPKFNGQEKLPAVLLVHGDVDPGVLDPELLHNAKDWGGYVSTSQLIAAAGLIGIPFNHRSAEGRVSQMWEVARDIAALVDYVRVHADELMIDAAAIGVWAWSDGVSYLSQLLASRPEQLRCLVAYYGVLDYQPFIETLPETLEQPQREKITNTLQAFSLINILRDQPKAIPPVLIARAGQDHPVMNKAIDKFVAEAQVQEVIVELADYPEGEHGFDSLDDGERASEIVKETLEFLKLYLVSA